MNDKIGIIGVSDFQIQQMTSLTFSNMLQRAKGICGKQSHIVSGGSALSDHLAVVLYLNEDIDHLILHLPCAFREGRFDDSTKEGVVLNKLHEKCGEAIDRDCLKDIEAAIDKGAQIIVTPGFLARNRKIVPGLHSLLAFGFNPGSFPTSNGTSFTWRICPKHVKKTYIQIQ